jgi:hypothetical protein
VPCGIGLVGRPASESGDYVRGRGPEAWPTPPPEGARVGYAQDQSNLYTVQIPDDLWLDWDAPMKKQSRKTLMLLKHALAANDTNLQEIADILWGDGDVSRLTGKSVYKKLADFLGSEQAASRALAKSGITGIRYLAGQLSGSDDGSYNYVVFDDKNVSIKSVE